MKAEDKILEMEEALGKIHWELVNLTNVIRKGKMTH